MRVGWFGILKKNHVDTDEKYSVSGKTPDYCLYLSPSVGVKMHLSSNIGIMASLSNDIYRINAYDTKRERYKNRFVSNIGINLGVCFQIPGW